MHRNADFSNRVKQKQIASNNREVRKTTTLKTPPLLTSDPYLRMVYTFYKLVNSKNVLMMTSSTACEDRYYLWSVY